MRMEAAVRTLITGIGEDLEREGLRDTPKVRPSLRPAAAAQRPRRRASGLTAASTAQRVAQAFVEMSLGYRQDVARWGAARHRAIPPARCRR